jgi:hypothetical protein
MDFFDRGPPPTSSPPDTKTAVITVAAFAVAIAFGVILFTGNFPGLPGHFTSHVQLNGHQYYSDVYGIPLPAIGANSTTPSAFTFHNVTFSLWVTGWYSALSSCVHGNGTEPNETTYTFGLGECFDDLTGPSLYISPDGLFAASWNGGFFMQLLVEV